MQAVVDTIDDAHLLAEDAGRQRITVTDLKRAIAEIRVPSDAAQKRVFAPAEERDGKADAQPGSDEAAKMPPPRGSFAADEFLL